MLPLLAAAELLVPVTATAKTEFLIVSFESLFVCVAWSGNCLFGKSKR